MAPSHAIYLHRSDLQIQRPEGLGGTGALSFVVVAPWGREWKFRSLEYCGIQAKEAGAGFFERFSLIFASCCGAAVLGLGEEFFSVL